MRLSAQSQRKEHLWTELERVGLTHGARKYMREQLRVEIFEELVASLALRVHVDDLCEPNVFDKSLDCVTREGYRRNHRGGARRQMKRAAGRMQSHGWLLT